MCTICYIYMSVAVRVWHGKVSFVWQKVLPAAGAVEILMLIVGKGGSNKTSS